MDEGSSSLGGGSICPPLSLLAFPLQHEVHDNFTDSFPRGVEVAEGLAVSFF